MITICDFNELYKKREITEKKDLKLDFNLPIRTFHPKKNEIFKYEIFWAIVQNRHGYTDKGIQTIFLMLNFEWLYSINSRGNLKKNPLQKKNKKLDKNTLIESALSKEREIFAEFRLNPKKKNSFREIDKVLNTLLNEMDIQDIDANELVLKRIFKDEITTELRHRNIQNFFVETLNKVNALTQDYLAKPDADVYKLVKNRLFSDDHSYIIRERDRRVNYMLEEIPFLLDEFEKASQNAEKNIFEDKYAERVNEIYTDLIEILIALRKVRVKDFKPKLEEWMNRIQEYSSTDFFTKIHGLKWIYDEFSDKDILFQWLLRIAEKLNHWFLSDFSRQAFKYFSSHLGLTATEKRLFILMNIGRPSLDYRLPVLDSTLSEYLLLDPKMTEDFLNLLVHRPTDNSKEWRKTKLLRAEKRIEFKNKFYKYLHFYSLWYEIVNSTGEYKPPKYFDVFDEEIHSDVNEIPIDIVKIENFEFLDELERICTAEQFEYLKLFYFDGKTQEEIAKELNVSQENVSKTINRTIEKLRNSSIIKDYHQHREVKYMKRTGKKTDKKFAIKSYTVREEDFLILRTKYYPGFPRNK